MSKIRAAIIGTGGISRCHMQGYRAMEDVEVVACCDIDGEKAKKYAEEFGIPSVYTDCREMMAKETLDVVSVTTWNAAHKDCTIAALRGGANVLCEKPMAMNAAEALEMQRTAEETGKLLQVGFVRRFGSDAKIFREFAQAGTFGEIYHGKVSYLRRSGCPGGWFGDKAFSGGGPLIDLGVHVIDLARYLAGNPKPVSVYGATYSNLGKNRASGSTIAWSLQGEKDPYPFNVEDFVTAMIRFDNGFTLTAEASFNLNIKTDTGRVQLFGTRGGALIEPEFEIYTDMAGRFVNVQTAAKVETDFYELFRRELRGFVEAACKGGSCVATAEDGVMLMKIIDGIYASAACGHEIVL